MLSDTKLLFDLRALKRLKSGIVGNYPCAPNIYICINIKCINICYMINDHTLAVHSCPTFTNTLSAVIQKLGICIVSFTCQSKCSSEMPNEAHARSPSTTPHWTCLQTRNGVALHLSMQGAVNDQLVTKYCKFCVRMLTVLDRSLIEVPFEPACQERKPPTCWSNLCSVWSKTQKQDWSLIALDGNLFNCSSSWPTPMYSRHQDKFGIPRLMGFGWLGQCSWPPSMGKDVPVWIWIM